MKRISLIFPLIFPILLNGNTILNETFPEGERLVANRPGTTSWTVSDTDLLTYESGSLTMTTDDSSDTGTNVLVLGQLAPISAPIELGIGQILETTFQISFSNPDSSRANVRVGILNLGGEIPDDGFSSANNASFSGTTGYAGAFTARSSTTSTNAEMELRKRTELSNSNLIAQSGRWTTLNERNGPVLFSDGVTNTGLIRIERTDTDEVSLFFELTGPDFTSTTSVSALDSSDIVTSFDTLALYVFRNSADSVTLSNVQVSVIPEPAFGVMAIPLGALLGLVFYRKKQRRRNP